MMPMPPGLGAPPMGGPEMGGPPPELAAMLAERMGGGPGGPPEGEEEPDELEAVQQVIQELHELLLVLKNPNHVSTATTCLGKMADIQKDMMAKQAGPGY